MPRLHGGQLLARALKAQGVGQVFTLSGAQIHTLYQGCQELGIRLVDARHEQAAVHMAEGWARATGQTGVALLTAGPGLTNGVTGVANAWVAGSPLVLLGGHSPLSQGGKGAFQEMDQRALLGPITRWSQTLYQGERIPELVAAAFRQARAGQPGPVYLELPEDVLEAPVEGKGPLEPYGPPPSPQADPSLVAQAVDLLLSHERALALAGGGLFWSGGGPELKELVEATQLPFLLMGQGRGVIPEDHPLYIGPFRGPLRQAEVVLLIGARLDWRLSYGELLSPQAQIIQVDINPSQIGHNRPAQVALVGDARAILRQMLQELRGRGLRVSRDPWLEECRTQARGRARRLEQDLLSDRVPIHPLRLCQEIGEFLGKEGTLVVDGGDISVFASWALRSYRPGRWLDNGPFWCLGTGLPFALAAKLARPQEPVLVLNGDGSFGMNAMEFHTALRHGLPIVVAISNDGAWGMMKHAQEEAFGQSMGTELGMARYDQMVAALGGYGEFVEKPQDIRPALERAFASGLPACLNVAVDPTASSRRGGEAV